MRETATTFTPHFFDSTIINAWNKENNCVPLYL